MSDLEIAAPTLMAAGGVISPAMPDHTLQATAIGQRTVLASRGVHRHAFGMLVITEADAAAIRTTFDQEGELSAVIELRRRFPGITDNTKARACARSIAGWMPLPAQPRPVTRLRPRKDA